MERKKIRIAVVGVGNCASSLIQGIHYYRNRDAEECIGLLNYEVGGYRPGDIEVVAAFDIDKRKVGRDVNEAVFALPNCTAVFCGDLPTSGVKVSMGKILDGYSEHMAQFGDDRTFLLAAEAEPSQADVVEQLKRAGVDVLMNYLPVGSQKATEFYAECALEAGCAFVNNIPVFIASNPEWAERFKMRNIPIIGDDIKAQLGATIVHRTLGNLFKKRGVKLERTYQLNTGGNTDFLNMLNRERLSSKKKSKTEAVQAAIPQRLDDVNIHVGPSDYVPWQNDNKVCFIRMEGKLFGDVAMNLELRLSVEDSPNSAGVAIDTIRCAKVALDRDVGGIVEIPSAFFCKHPPKQIPDDDSYAILMEEWV
ncbi:inositol-3-phosphate synthase [Porticoccus sp.]